ncbi:hypothetical protein NM208_g7845 [Fusarium decemcellulare]|uniref:Uncharacterized protein n=1 Tax=Fusarium decemcellulare TaxID=57161 RepID=A0ACC1S7L2_9HYPO|nr:hypothetical protein NM208_g7845 [Fusarium decemcellulare]
MAQDIFPSASPLYLEFIRTNRPSQAQDSAYNGGVILQTLSGLPRSIYFFVWKPYSWGCGFIPFHERPWDAFKARSGKPHDLVDIADSVTDCEFCAFTIGFAAEDLALDKPRSGSFANHDVQAPRHGFANEPLLCAWNYSEYSYDGHISAELRLQRHRDHARGRRGPAFRLFEASDPRMQCHKPIDHASKSTSSDASFERLSYWIKNCSQNHESCNKLHARKAQDYDWLPTRLVKIIAAEDGTPKEILVQETAKIDYGTAEVNYAALSYCWGPNPSFIKLTQSNFRILTTAGVPIEDLPTTFRDAIVTTWRLGLQYLWVDSLCIVQDSINDWTQEAVTMAKVYSYSVITLAAAASPDAEGGLFRKRNPAAINGAQMDLTWSAVNLEGSFKVVPEDPWLKAVVKSPLLRRAWAFQERLLSRGTVFFTHNMLYWECGELYASELYPEGGPWDLKYRYKRYDLGERLPQGVQIVEDGRFKHVYTALLTSDKGVDGSLDAEISEKFVYTWASIIAQYSIGGLSKESDKLVAIDGVAEQMAAIIPKEQYLTGLWRQPSLPLFLLWYSYKTTKQARIPLAPSWSWASTHSRVEFNFLFRAQTEPQIAIAIVDILTSPSHSTHNAAFGSSKTSDALPSTALVLRGPLAEVRVRSVTRYNLGPLHSSYWREVIRRHEKKNCKWKLLNWKPRVVFPGKGLKADYPCKMKFDQEVPQDSRIFALKVAEADLRYPWAHRVPVDCGLLLAPAWKESPRGHMEVTNERGLFVRVGYFEIARGKMGRDLADWAQLKFKSLRQLREGIWKNSRIDQSFWKDWDGEDGYTITVI